MSLIKIYLVKVCLLYICINARVLCPCTQIRWQRHIEFSATAAALASPATQTSVLPQVTLPKLDPMTHIPSSNGPLLPSGARAIISTGRKWEPQEQFPFPEGAVKSANNALTHVQVLVGGVITLPAEAPHSLSAVMGLPAPVLQFQRASSSMGDVGFRPRHVPEEHFITIGKDGNFMDGCRTFYPAGWNQCAEHSNTTPNPDHITPFMP